MLCHVRRRTFFSSVRVSSAASTTRMALWPRRADHARRVLLDQLGARHFDGLLRQLALQPPLLVAKLDGEGGRPELRFDAQQLRR